MCWSALLLCKHQEPSGSHFEFLCLLRSQLTFSAFWDFFCFFWPHHSACGILASQPDWTAVPHAFITGPQGKSPLVFSLQSLQKASPGVDLQVQGLPCLSLLIAEFPGGATPQGDHQPGRSSLFQGPPSPPGPCSWDSSHLMCPILSAWPQFCPSCMSQPHLWDYLSFMGYHYCPWALNALKHLLSYLGNGLQIYCIHVLLIYIFYFVCNLDFLLSVGPSNIGRGG